MADLLSGTTAVVTGSASGNGRAIATAFAEHGADVVVADVREDPREGGPPTRELIAERTDAAATFVRCDVTDRADLERTMDAAEEFGGVDTMVNNAGILTDATFMGTSEAEYERIMTVNLKGVFFGGQIAAERMIDGGGGSIINVSSTSGLLGSRNAAYSASKGAIRTLTYAMADALGPAGIRVNAIHPGTIETRMVVDDVDSIPEDDAERERFLERIPLGRIGRPEDVADAAVFLASDLAGYVSAESLVVDGGRTYTGR